MSGSPVWVMTAWQIADIFRTIMLGFLSIRVGIAAAFGALPPLGANDPVGHCRDAAVMMDVDPCRVMAHTPGSGLGLLAVRAAVANARRLR